LTHSDPESADLSTDENFYVRALLRIKLYDSDDTSSSAIPPTYDNKTCWGLEKFCSNKNLFEYVFFSPKLIFT